MRKSRTLFSYLLVRIFGIKPKSGNPLETQKPRTYVVYSAEEDWKGWKGITPIGFEKAELPRKRGFFS